MLLVTSAENQRGWSPTDYLIDDERLAEIVGCRYRTLASLLSAARAREDARGYARVEYVIEETGERWVVGTEPSFPGRSRLYRRLCP